jgi:hypothetical protein
MSKHGSNLLLIALITVSLILVGAGYFAKAQSSGTNIYGAITKDTTWIQANSPYTFTDGVTVNKGVTLIIEPGVTVVMMGNGFSVYGELVAIGTSNNPIKIYGNAVGFQANSIGWNSATDSGSIIKNAILPEIVVFNSSPK